MLKRKSELAELAKAAEGLESDRRLFKAQSKSRNFEVLYKEALKQLDIAESRNEFIAELNRPPSKRYIKPASIKPKTDLTIAWIYTDWHAEERVDPATINGLNKFDLDICAERIDFATERNLFLTDVERYMAPSKLLIVGFLGDLITGFLHDDQKESNYLTPTEASLFVQDRCCEILNTILKRGKFDRIIVPCSYGNHGRNTVKPRSATAAKNSYEWLLYQQLQRQWARESKIEWRIASGYHNIVNLWDRFKINFHHGDKIRYAGGVGGISIPVNKAVKAWNEALPCNLHVFGHWHQMKWDNNWISCPCLIGYNAYAKDEIKAVPEPPSQLFFSVDKNHGLTTVKRVRCE